MKAIARVPGAESRSNAMLSRGGGYNGVRVVWVRARGEGARAKGTFGERLPRKTSDHVLQHYVRGTFARK